MKFKKGPKRNLGEILVVGAGIFLEEDADGLPMITTESGGESPFLINDLIDVTITSVQNNDILQFNNSLQVWENRSSLTTITGTFSGRITITDTQDVNLVGASGGLIIGGDGSGIHLALDGNEIMAKTNATTVATLNLQVEGGGIAVGVSSTVGYNLELGSTALVSGVAYAVRGTANRANTGENLLRLTGRWNVTNVARISFRSGSDTTNKDDGRIVFLTAPDAATGLLARWNIREDGHLRTGLDNSYDIGQLASLRPRSGYFGTSLSAGTNPASTGAFRAQFGLAYASRNAANTADVNLIILAGTDELRFRNNQWRILADGSLIGGTDPAGTLLLRVGGGARFNGLVELQGGAALALTDGTNTVNILTRTAYNSGYGASLNPGQGFAVGGGEAADLVRTNIALESTENLYLVSDATVLIESNLQPGYGSRFTWTFDTVGGFTTPGDVIIGTLGRFDAGSVPDLDDTLRYNGTEWIPVALQYRFTAGDVISQAFTDSTAAAFVDDGRTVDDVPAPVAPSAAPILIAGYKSIAVDMSAHTLPADKKLVVQWSTDSGVSWSDASGDEIVTTGSKIAHTKLLIDGTTYRYRFRERGITTSAPSPETADLAPLNEPDITLATIILAAQIATVDLSAISANIGVIVAGLLRNLADTHGILLSGAMSDPSPSGWNRFINLVDETDNFIEHERFKVHHDGTITISDGTNVLFSINTSGADSFWQDSGATRGINIKGTLPVGWTRYLDLAVTGANPFLKHEALELLGDGSADFSGVVSSQKIISSSMALGPDANPIGTATLNIAHFRVAANNDDTVMAMVGRVTSGGSLFRGSLVNYPRGFGVDTVSHANAGSYARLHLGGWDDTTVEIVGTGNLSNFYGLRITQPQVGTTATVTNLYGIKIENMDRSFAIAHFAIHTGLGHTSLGGNSYCRRFNNGTSGTFDFNNGNVQSVQNNGAKTVVLNNSEAGGVYVLEITATAGAASSWTWPGSVKWRGGSAPVLTTTSGRTDIITLLFAGTNHYASAALNHF